MGRIKGWFKDKWTRTKEFCVQHPDAVLAILGGLFSLAGGALEIYGNKTEFKDNIFTTDSDGNVYKVKAKRMTTAKSFASEDKE